MLKKQSKKITKAKEVKDTLRFLQQISKEDLAMAIMVLKPEKRKVVVRDLVDAVMFVGTDKKLIEDIFKSSEKILTILKKVVIAQGNDLGRRN
ncbi:hypothetical protein A2911_00135 [Candidatus Nomurabacteria bacterium RIFCSPLOWO2_01_FULL_40_15]|uniref:Uncharacterized protein n=1 Tax=Candidatus Nomurabacteria bacterium RIFCSPLOWO2_01_FULL_40_15 TaxID=1801772 RepID=A0A1F6X8Q4_9BACT|nr:MAG: hypothetical protein A2911_00135 [Candidatus Nomurabacteria bacterium RIFCSPLOWO2_01_FULL_40_15]